MLPRIRNIVLLLLLALGCGPLFAAVSATATLTVKGGEQPFGTWDSGSMTVSFNGFSETVHYSQFSSSSSLASALAAMFTRDCNRYGLWAKAGAHSNSDPTVITFQLTNGQPFGSISYSVSSASFTLAPSGFASSGSVVADSGTVTLQVNGATISTAHYADGSTPTSIAQSLADAASSSLVTVQSDGNLLYLASKLTGSTVNYPYTITVTPATNNFPTPSFTISPMNDTMSGGANASSSSGSIYSYSITNSSGGSGYDAAGNILNLTDSVMGTWAYGYDNLNRLVAGHATTGAYSSQTPYLCWSYDSFGNRTHQTLSNQAFVNATGSACQTASGASLVDTSTVPAANNQISSSTLPGSSTAVTPMYDSAGNVTFDGTNTYLYDAEGRVCAVHGVFGMTGYQYDAAGQRVGKGTITSMGCDVTSNGYLPTTDYVLDQGGGQMTELAVDENGTVAWQHTNVTAGGTLIATYDLNGLHFYLNDALGTRRAQTDSAGVLEQNCLSLPFGDQLSCTISTSGPTEHHFTGKERDAETGLDYFGARYYASNIGRWISPDDSADGSLSNPQDLNLYSYGHNSPLSLVDPDGHTAIPAQSAHIANAIKQDRTLSAVFIGANNFSPGGFENAFNSGKLNSLSSPVGNTLRGLAGEAQVIDDINGSFWQRFFGLTTDIAMVGAAGPKLPGVTPDVFVLYQNVGLENGPPTILQNIANTSGIGDISLNGQVTMNFLEVKSGVNATSISTGVDQAIATARAISASGLGGSAVSTLVVDAGAWASLKPDRRASYVSKASAAGAYIQVEPGLADTARQRAQNMVDRSQ